MTAKFIVFEGIDGSGTSTQAELLKLALVEKGISCHATSEPSDGPIGNLIRQIFKGRVYAPTGDNPHIVSGNLFDEQMAYLFAADRHDHLYNKVDGVYKLLSEGVHVVSTRYYFSSYAYHCSHEEDFSLVRALNSRFPSPDLVIYLDNPVQVSMERIKRRAFQDSYETQEKLLMAKKNYDKAFQEHEGKIIKLNATHSAASIHAKVLEELEKIIGNPI